MTRTMKLAAVLLVAVSSLFTLGAGCDEAAGVEAFGIVDKTALQDQGTSLIGPALHKGAVRNQGVTMISPVRR